MISSTISSEAPLIYYSYSQVIQEEYANREINAANKITIRKHNDYKNNGIEFLIYNCALNPIPELCNGIRQTYIINDHDKIDFEGKGLSGNGIPLTNLYGCFFNNKGMLELITAKKNRTYIYHYLNCYRNEHPEVFNIDMKHVHEFFRSTYNNLRQISAGPDNFWIKIRACILNYYQNKYNWTTCPLPVFPIEWDYMKKIDFKKMRITLLKDIEGDMDKMFFEAFQYFKKGEHDIFQRKLDSMIAFQGIYYLLYQTLL